MEMTTIIKKLQYYFYYFICLAVWRCLARLGGRRGSGGAAILVHHIRIATNATIGLSDVVEPFHFEPGETQHRICGDLARVGGTTALVQHANRRRDAYAWRQAGQAVQMGCLVGH
jgi:hypothetical protein